MVYSEFSCNEFELPNPDVNKIFILKKKAFDIFSTKHISVGMLMSVANGYRVTSSNKVHNGVVTVEIMFTLKANSSLVHWHYVQE